MFSISFISWCNKNITASVVYSDICIISQPNLYRLTFKAGNLRKVKLYFKSY